MAAQISMLHIWVGDDIKKQATVALTTMGLSASDAVRLFLRRVVVDQTFPLALRVPNAQTQAESLKAHHDGQTPRRRKPRYIKRHDV